jgi:predicted MFS family arabinose efflux permease
MVQLLGNATPVLLFSMIAIVLGVPNGLNNIGLQTGLYEASPPERTGSSGGLFQTFRYLGAILASSLLGVILDRDLSTRGLHHVGLALTAGAAVLLLLAFLLPRNLSQGRRT